LIGFEDPYAGLQVGIPREVLQHFGASTPREFFPAFRPLVERLFGGQGIGEEGLEGNLHQEVRDGVVVLGGHLVQQVCKAIGGPEGAPQLVEDTEVRWDTRLFRVLAAYPGAEGVDSADLGRL
jgi:hypothetical protein